jgi:hypothetical protein
VCMYVYIKVVTVRVINSTSVISKEEVNSETPFHKILWHLKSHLQVRTKIPCKAKFIISVTHSSCLLPDDRQISFSLAISLFHHGSLCSYVSPGG